MNKIQAIKQETKDWLSKNIDLLKQEAINIEILIDSENCLRILLDSDDKMGEFLIEEPDFAPYKNFKFEIAQIVDGRAQIIKAWYDNESTNIEDYKVILNSGMNEMN